LPLQKKVPIIDQELQQNPNKDPENGVSHGESLSALKKYSVFRNKRTERRSRQIFESQTDKSLDSHPRHYDG
jgi:hypothetical protein